MLADVYIGQTPIEGQRHVPDKALADGGEGSEERVGDESECAQNDEKVQISL